MAACVENTSENTSLFLVVDMPKVKLEVIAETEEGDESSLLSSVLEKGGTNNNGGSESDHNGGSDGHGALKVRDNLIPKKGRKLPHLSFSSSSGGSTEEEKIQKDQLDRRVVTSPKVLSSTHGDDCVTPSGSKEDKTLPSNTLQSCQQRVTFQKKKQLFERGEGALLAKRALTRRPLTHRNGRRRLPKVPDQSMDPIDKVVEANRVQPSEFDLEGSENDTSGISSLDSASSGTVVNKDFKIAHSDESNEQLILSGSVQTTKEVTDIKLHKFRETPNEEDEDIVNSAYLLQIKSHSSYSNISSDSNYTSIDASISGLSNDSTTLKETAESLPHSFPKGVGQTIKIDSETSQHSIEGLPQFSPDNNNNLDQSRSQLESEAGKYSEGVAFDESGMGDDLGQTTVQTKAIDHIRGNTQTEEEEVNKPLQHSVNSLGDLNANNTHRSDIKEHNLSLDGQEHPSEKIDLDSQLVDLKVSADTLHTSKRDSELVESPRGDKQLFQLLLDDSEDDFHTDDEEEGVLEEQDSGEQQTINSSSEIEDKQLEEEHFQRKLVRNDAIDEDDSDMTKESTARDCRMDTTQIESNEINEESKINNSFNQEQLSLQGDIDTAGRPKSEMELNGKYDEVDEKNEIKSNYSEEQDGDEAETYRPDSEVDSSKYYHKDLSVNDDQNDTSESQEMLGQNKMDVVGNFINRNTSSKLEVENTESMFNLQANQNNEYPGLEGRTMSENTEISDTMQPDITVHSKPPPTGENSSVAQYSHNISRNEMKINSDEKQDTPNLELESNILVKEHESVGEVPSSEQTLKSIKSLGNHERQLGDDITDTQDGTRNKTVITSVDPKSSLIQEPFLGNNHPNSQKLIKYSESEEAEDGDEMIKRQKDKRQMGEQQNNQRKESDEDLSHSLPGDDKRQTRNMTPLVNEQLEVKSNAIEEENNQHVKTSQLNPARVAASGSVTQEYSNYENPVQNKVAVDNKNYRLENDRKIEKLPEEEQHAMRKDDGNFGVSIQGHQMSKKVSYSTISSNGPNESIPRKSALKVRQERTGNDYMQNNEGVGTFDIVTEGPILTNNIHDTNRNGQETSQNSNLSGGPTDKSIVKENDKEFKASDSVPRKPALKVRQVPTGNDNIQSTEAVGNHAMVNEGLIARNHNISDTSRTVQDPLKPHLANVTSGPGENGITKEKVSMGSENSQKESKAKIKIYPERQDQAEMKVIKGEGAFVQPQRRPNVDQKQGKENGTNRHEGHNCPRELRRLAKQKEAEEQAIAGSQNQSSHRAPDETTDGAAVTRENPPVTSRQAFPGQSSQEAANSELIQTPASPSSKKRRKKKPADPFDGLPPIKPWHLHQLEINAEIMERPKKKKKGQRRFNISQFDDPFHQMLWVLFRAADRDSNNKLNKKELSSIFSSPKLQLSLTQDDIKRLLKESSTDEQADPKTCELSFEEFIPLGRLILMLYYSKTDDSSQSKWCILDKGQDYGIIYFNKLTGDASISVPSDYYADVLHEPDLLDIAIHDLFEDADLNEDGKINLTDFLRILRSEDFGLFLTNGDIEEIMKYFVNARGKEMMVQFDEFLPLAKRLILTVYRARDPTPHEWCHLYTRNVGSFWFNKRTGQADRHPPTSLVRTLQDLLEHRSREIEVFMEVAEDLHHTKEALQIETEKRQGLEENLSELTKQHETTTKELAKTSTALEKSKEEVEQKSKQIRFFEKEKVKQQNLIQSLQDRADEADRIEANLESLRNVLQSTQTSVREKEFDVRDLANTLEETRKELASTKQHSANLQDKVDDLVVQLRDEIRRNERVEKELERTKSYKFEKVEVEDILKETKDELEMRMNQLTHARYEIRDNKSRIRRIETELNNVPDLKTQLEEKEKEVKSLKEKIEKLEAQMIEDARLADRYPRELVRRRRWNKARSIETPDKSHDCSDPNCPVNGRTSASSSPMWAYRNNEESQTQPNGSFLELLSNIEGEDGRDSLNIYDFYEPHYPEVSPHRVRIDSASAPHRKERSRLVRPKSSAGRLETKRQSKLGRGVFVYEEDYLLARFVKEGDRVRIKKSGVNILGMKPSDLRTATVRYVGQLDEEGAEHMLFVGLHMDDAVGDTNGIIDDKRYFYSKRKHGKMVRITEVLYLLNSKTTSFDKISDLVEEYKASRRKRWREYPEEGPRLIRVT